MKFKELDEGVHDCTEDKLYEELKHNATKATDSRGSLPDMNYNAHTKAAKSARFWEETARNFEKDVVTAVKGFKWYSETKWQTWRSLTIIINASGVVEKLIRTLCEKYLAAI